MITIPAFKVGTITHYYDHLGVAVVDLVFGLHTGDLIKVLALNPFVQEVKSMQIDHVKVDACAAGDTVGLQVSYPVKPGDEIVLAQ